MWNVRERRWEGRHIPDDWDYEDDCAKRDARLKADYDALTMTVDCWRCGAPVTVLVKDFIADNTIDHCDACYAWTGRRSFAREDW